MRTRQIYRGETWLQGLPPKQQNDLPGSLFIASDKVPKKTQKGHVLDYLTVVPRNIEVCVASSSSRIRQYGPRVEADNLHGFGQDILGNLLHCERTRTFGKAIDGTLRGSSTEHVDRSSRDIDDVLNRYPAVS